MTLFRAVVVITSPILGGHGVNVFHGDTSGDEVDSVTALMGAVEDFYDTFKVVFPENTDISWDGTAVTFNETAPALIETGAPWTVLGTGSEHPAPPATALVVGWQTALRTRSGRGRTFLGPMDRDQVQDNGTPYEEIRTMIEDAAASLVADQAGGTHGFLGVWSPTDEALRAFTGAKVANRFAVLRSRRD